MEQCGTVPLQSHFTLILTRHFHQEIVSLRRHDDSLESELIVTEAYVFLSVFMNL